MHSEVIWSLARVPLTVKLTKCEFENIAVVYLVI